MPRTCTIPTNGPALGDMAQEHIYIWLRFRDLQTWQQLNGIDHAVKLSCAAEPSDWNMITVESPTGHQEFGHINEVVVVKALLLKREKNDWLAIQAKNSARITMEITGFHCIVELLEYFLLHNSIRMVARKRIMTEAVSMAKFSS